MKTYFAAIIPPLKYPIVWGTGNTENGARMDALHWINDYYPSYFAYAKQDRQDEKKRLKIIKVTERVKKLVDDEGGSDFPPLKLKNGVYDLK